MILAQHISLRNGETVRNGYLSPWYWPHLDVQYCKRHPIEGYNYSALSKMAWNFHLWLHIKCGKQTWGGSPHPAFYTGKITENVNKQGIYQRSENGCKAPSWKSYLLAFPYRLDVEFCWRKGWNILVVVWKLTLTLTKELIGRFYARDVRVDNTNLTSETLKSSVKCVFETHLKRRRKVVRL